MKHLWGIAGIIFYWMSWPATALLVPLTRRCRIFVLYRDEFLVVRTWHSSGHLGLPGGGIKRGEDAEHAALRELREETGIHGQPLEYRGNTITKARGIRSPTAVYVVRLSSKPRLTGRAWEVLDYKWKRQDSILHDRTLDPTIKQLSTHLQG